jgi:hypothetical protein
MYERIGVDSGWSPPTAKKRKAAAMIKDSACNRYFHGDSVISAVPLR